MSHANWQVSRFELNILKFQGDPQLEEFLNWVLAVQEVFEFNKVLDETIKKSHTKKRCLGKHGVRRRVHNGPI
jgi:hypothetical protein